MTTFKKPENIAKINYARREFHKTADRIHREPIITNIKDIRKIIFVADFDFEDPKIKEYYFNATREPFRIDSYLIFDQEKFRFQKGFARGLREIAKDFDRVLSENSL